MVEEDHESRFGEVDPDVAYTARPSAYVVIRDATQRIAVVRAPQGLFLPGGGIEPGETPHDAALREAMEETGLMVEISSALGVATEFVRAKDGTRTGWVKPSTFFRAFVIKAGSSSEPDHDLVWVTQGEAEAGLSHESHVWAIVRDSA